MGIIPVTPLYTATIADLGAEALVRCENRSDTARANIWVKDALLEIAGNADYRDEFDDLEVLGPPFILTIGTQEYPMDALVPAGDYNLATLDVLIWTDPPTNSNRLRLDYTHFQEADVTQVANQRPTAWYRFGANIGFNCSPDNAYQVQARVLRRHPIADNSGDIGTTVVLLPREWHEIIIWAACIRGFMELLEFEKAGEIRQMLYGDPKDPKKPGLVNSVKRRRQLEQWRQQSQLRPSVRGYGWGRY